ncbi:MAG: hypothetical protein IPK87_04810 [Planctomycetes bacterium]|nr:hypothetical protein [Planctomycetota bacterium]
MSKKMGLIVLILGVVVMGAAILDLTNMADTPKGDAVGVGSEGSLGTWPPLRIAILSAGALLGVLGAYGLVKKEKKKE